MIGKRSTFGRVPHNHHILWLTLITICHIEKTNGIWEIPDLKLLSLSTYYTCWYCSNLNLSVPASATANGGPLDLQISQEHKYCHFANSRNVDRGLSKQPMTLQVKLSKIHYLPCPVHSFQSSCQQQHWRIYIHPSAIPFSLCNSH